MSAKLMVIGGKYGYSICMLYKPGAGGDRDIIEGYVVFYDGKKVGNFDKLADAYSYIDDAHVIAAQKDSYKLIVVGGDSEYTVCIRSEPCIDVNKESIIEYEVFLGADMVLDDEFTNLNNIIERIFNKSPALDVSGDMGKMK